MSAAAAAGPGRPRFDRESAWETFRPYLAPHLRSLLVLGVASFLGGISEAALLVVLARLAVSIGGVEGGISEALGPFGEVDLTHGALFGLALVLVVGRGLFQGLAAHLTARVTRDMMVGSRRDTFDDYIRTGWELQADRSEAEVQDLLGRQINRTTVAVTSLAQGAATACTLSALVLSALLVDPVAALLIVTAGGLLFVALRPVTRLAKKMARRQLAAGQAYAARAYEAVGLSLEIRAFGATDEVSRLLARETEAEARPIYVSQLLTRLLSTVYQTLAVLILLGALAVVDAAFDRPLASLGAVVVILVRSLNVGGTLQGVYHTIVETGPFAANLTEERARFRAGRPVEGDHPVPPAPRLQLDAVDYTYPAGATGLEGVSLTIEPGEAVGLIGPSGSGKSTLIQVLLRLRTPTAGRYLVDGIDAREVGDEAWFARAAFVPQDCRVIDASVADNIRFFRPGVTQEQVEQAARRAHVHDEILAMPDGYATSLGSRGGALSGGQRQRVAIARALVRDPSVLVLDEPTSALDMRSEALVHETFTSLKGEVTLVVIAHRLSTLNTCDRILVMGDGRLQAAGTREELDRDSAFYRQALELSRIRS